MTFTSAGRCLASTLVTAAREGPGLLRIAPRARHRYLEGAAHGLSDPAWEATFRATIAEWFAEL